MNIEEINHLSYPQLKLILSRMYEPKTLNLVIPYMGGESQGGKAKGDVELQSANDFATLISQMNSDFN